MVEYFHERLYVHGTEGAILGECVCGVADEEVFIEEPDIGFDASAAPSEGIIEGNPAPVVVVRVTGDRGYIFGNIQQVSGHVCRGLDGPGPFWSKDSRVISNQREIPQRNINDMDTTTNHVSISLSQSCREV